MKRLFVFLAIFAAGLGVLLWIQSRMRKPAPPPVAPTSIPAAQTEPQGELTTLQTERGKQVETALSGPLEMFPKWPDSLRLRSHVTAKNVVSTGGGVYELTGVVLEHFEDTPSNDLDSEIHAARGRAKVNVNLSENALDEGFVIPLYDVVATLQRGSRFSPVTIRVPEIEGQIGTQHFESREHVELEGRGLRANGKGLVVDGTTGLLRLLEDPSASVELASSNTARISSHGELSIHSRPDLGPDAAELKAQDRAVLHLDGPHEFELQADVISLVGTLVPGADKRFVPTSASAQGHVRLVPRDGVFTGNTATFEFDPEGKPLHAALDGEPRCELVLRGERLANVPPELLVEGETLTVTLDGAGPLEVFFDEGERFEFTGPATLKLPMVGSTLHANGSIGGSLGADGKFHELKATNGTTVDYEGAHLETEELTVTEFVDERQHAAYRFVAKGATHSTGTLRTGGTFDLTTTGGMTAERRGDGLRVPEGEGVTLVVTGDQGFRTTADHVRNFDAELMTLDADGHVHFENAEGSGDGEQLETFAPQHGELIGTDEKPAHFKFKEGEAEAHYIEFEPDRIQARVGAHARVDFGKLHYDLGARWAMVERNPKPEDREPQRGYVLDAGGDVRADITGDGETWSLRSQNFHAVSDVARDEQGNDKLTPSYLSAGGGVAFEYHGQLDLTGSGDRLVIGPDRVGHLYPSSDPDARIEMAGTMPDGLHFKMQGQSVDFSPDRLVAIGPEIDVEGLDLPWVERGAPASERAIRAVAGRMACDRNSLLFSEGAYIGGRTPTHEDWSLDAPRVYFSGSVEQAQTGIDFGALHDVIAWGGFSARLGAMGSLSGEQLELVNARRTITISGEPAEMRRPEATWSSTWFDVDLDSGFVRSEAGQVHAIGDPSHGDWTMRYAALEPVTREDETIQIFREPVITSGDFEVRASWAIAWIDATEWRKLTGAVLPKPGEVAPPAEPAPAKPDKQRRSESLFERYKLGEISKWLREFYLEGNVEYRKQDQRYMRAESAYVDLIDGHGWFRDVDLTAPVDIPFVSRDYVLKVHADWLHHAVNGTLQAFNATGTSCTFDKPHYVIRIGDFSMLPRFKEVPVHEKKPAKKHGKKAVPEQAQQPEQPEQVPPVEPAPQAGAQTTPPATKRKQDGWDISLEHNSIASPGGVELPIPRVAFPTDKNFNIDPNALSLGGLRIPTFGKDSKFGTFIGTSFTTELGWIALKFSALFNKFIFPALHLKKPDGHTTISGRYMGARGGIVGTETELRQLDENGAALYYMNVRLDVVYDQGDDHGLVRVPKSDREPFRGWFRERGRILLDDAEWIDAVITYQSDPGVQAEFFENDFLEYEERETYLHWRKADGVHYWNATIEARLEDFRTEVVDQPSLEYFRGRSQIGSWGKYALLYSSDSSLAHLARFDGEQPYEQPFADGLGDRDVLRLDTSQRIDMPIPLGVLGVRATPFGEAHVTGWDENAAEDSQASRAALLGGVELATTFWKAFENGSRHVWSPSIAYHADVASTEHGDPVVVYDTIDRPLDGQFVDVAVRSRWTLPELKNDLDIEMRQTWAADVPAGDPDGWLPLAVRASWLSSISGMPYGITHDAHYDTANGETDYSRTFGAWEPRPDLDFELGYTTGRDLAGVPLFTALSLGARYDLSTKWEIEGHQTLSVKDNGDRLGSSFVLRRIGHDFLFEIATSFVAGEGGSSISFNIQPLLTWRRPETTMIDRWRAQRRY